MNAPVKPVYRNGYAEAAGLPAPQGEPLILSIVPAPPGWCAVWRDAMGEVLEPVACWALVEVPGHSPPMRYVQALVYQGEPTATLDLANEGYNGLKYAAPGAELVRAYPPPDSED